MDCIELLDQIYLAVTSVRSGGRKTIRVSALEKYLLALRADVLSSKPITGKEEHSMLLSDARLAEYNAQVEYDIAHHNAVVVSGQAALRSAVIINGGAAAALLAFIGAIYNSDQGLCATLAYSLMAFSMGVLSSSIAFGLTYLANYYGTEKTMKRFFFFNSAAIFFTVLAYCLFLLGSLNSYRTFLPPKS